VIGRATPRRFAINVASGFGSLALGSVIGMWYTPFMIRHLGVAVYGLVPLANSITNYLSIVTGAIGSTVARFIVADLARGDADNANRHFNTFLAVGGAIAAGLFAVSSAFGLTLFPVVFKIPPGQERAAEYVFIAVTGTFLLSTITNVFASSIWVANRFEIQSLIDGATSILRVGLIVVFFQIWTPALWQVAIALTGAGVFALVAMMLACRKLAPALRVRPSDFDRTKVAELRYTGSWLGVCQIGNVLFYYMDLILADVLLGPKALGYYAPLVQWLALLRMLAGMVAGVLGPPLIVFFARREMDSLLRVSRQAAKFLGLLMALPIGLLCGFGRPLLQTWLGRSLPDIVRYAPLVWLLLLPMCLEAAQMHLGSVIIAANRLRTPGLFYVGSGLAYVLGALWLARHFQLGLYGVALAGAVVSVARSLFNSTYATRVSERKGNAFVGLMARAAAAAFAIAGAAWIASHWLVPGSWIRLGLFAAPLGALYLWVAYSFLLNEEDRTRVKHILFLRGAPETEAAPATSASR
jgi:O-antigen/teichoic acid export membrane protein